MVPRVRLEWRRAWVVLAAAMVLVPATTRAGEISHAPAATLAAATARDSVAGAPTPAPAAPHDYVAEVRANYTPENRAYWTTSVVLELVGILFSFAVGMFFLFSRLSARIRDFAHARAGGRYGRMLIYFTIYTLLDFLIALPLSWYQGFALEHRYHLSNQSLGAWFGDEMKGLAIGIAFFGVVPLTMLAYLAMERIKRWWLVLALGSIPVVVIATLIQPIVIDPMFNKFTPLRDQVLKRQILELAAKAGISSRNVYEVDKSAQTNKYNAYVNGFGASQRIVLWDTTLKGMKPDEILFVMGHEMGHYRLGHIWKGIAFFSALSFALFFSAGLLMTWAVRRFGGRWGFHELHDIASLPLFGVALSVASLVTQPLASGYTRSIEHQADTFGLEVTHLNDAAARAFIKLGSQNKSNPEPPRALVLFEYSHPPVIERVRYALEYHPWEQGLPNQAFHPKP